MPVEGQFMTNNTSTSSRNAAQSEDQGSATVQSERRSENPTPEQVHDAFVRNTDKIIDQYERQQKKLYPQR